MCIILYPDIKFSLSLFCTGARNSTVIIGFKSTHVNIFSSFPESRSESFDSFSLEKKKNSVTSCLYNFLLQNLHSKENEPLLFYTSLPNHSRDQASVNHILRSHVPLFSPLIEKCKSPAEPLVTSRQTLASHSSAQTSPPGYLEIAKCEIRIHKALALIECVCRIQNNTFYLPHIHMLHGDRHPQD